MNEELNQLLEGATGTVHNILVNRCNSAILMVLKLAKKVNGKKVVLVQDQGGWLSYEKLAKKAGLEIRKIKTKDGVIVDYKQLFDEDVCAVLFTQVAGYCLKQEWNIKHLLATNKSKALAIMDCSGCIGTPLCNGAFADLVVASFGKWKALDVGYGGVIGTSTDEYFEILKELK
ncbi:MAG: DegT/DnrJ/EryC1/StrS family aminotransferase, partial [Nanoarchaeota archaeon]|nr:DegT/DnrJ/EryC1/StrS family aminotransferase [Nanoarchaeota archaeon]